LQKRITITPESSYFPIFQKVVKEIGNDKSEVKIQFINKARSAKIKQEVKETLLFKFDWQTDDICGIEVFKELNDG
jgi:hypothetical protein